MEWDDLEVWYVPGPYRSVMCEYGIRNNITKAIELGRELIGLGKVPLIPHLNTAFFDHAADDSVWLLGDIVMMDRCNAALVARGWERSSGTRTEIDYCLGKGLPVYCEPEDRSQWNKLKEFKGVQREKVELPKMDLVGIIGPYHRGENINRRREDVHNAEKAALEVWRTDKAVICPQKNFWFLDHFLERDGPRTRQQFIYALLDRCDYAVAMPTWARDKDATGQVKFCMDRGMDVYVPSGEFKSKEECFHLTRNEL